MGIFRGNEFLYQMHILIRISTFVRLANMFLISLVFVSDCDADFPCFVGRTDFFSVVNIEFIENGAKVLLSFTEIDLWQIFDIKAHITNDPSLIPEIGKNACEQVRFLTSAPN